MQSGSNRFFRLMLLASLVLGVAPAAAAESLVPPAPSGSVFRVERDYADSVARGAFGLKWDAVVEVADGWEYNITGFVDNRSCPLQSIRGLSCEQLDWLPSRLRIHRDGWEGALSGHLAVNRVVAVDMQSDSAPFAIGSMHGVLVASSSGIEGRKAPAFGWYLSRSAESVGMSFLDVSGDGLEDVIYTYRQTLPGGVLVVPRDIWSFADMTASKYLSSGEKVSGVSTSTFEGVPAMLVTDGRTELGRFVLRFARDRSQGTAGTTILTVERAVFTDGRAPSWELQVLADSGSGWFDFLSVVGTPRGDGDAPDPWAAGSGDDVDFDPDSDFTSADRCAFSELPVDAPIEMRRAFLDIEGICRFIDEPVQATLPLARAALMLFRAIAMQMAGYPMIAAVMFESAAQELYASGLSGLFSSVLASLSSSAASLAICPEDGALPCWADPGDGRRGLASDWIADLAEPVLAAWDGMMTWIAGVVAGDGAQPEGL